MKKLAGLVGVFMLFATINAQEQGVKLSSLSLSAGKGALSSGLFFEANFTNGNDVFALNLGHNDLYFYYLKGFVGGKVSVGPCLEYYYNTPTVGAMVSINPNKYISTLSWAGWSAGVPGGKITPLKWRFLYFYQGLDLTYKRIVVGGAIMYYEGWQPLLNIKYVHPVTERISISTNVGYNFFEYKTKEWGESALLGMKMTYNFK